jgi:hypothetical protein
MLKRRILLFLCAVGLVIAVCGGGQAIVIKDSLLVTDVTTVQFCVIWTTSKPASGSVNVFYYPVDSDVLEPYPKAVVVFESAEHPPAEDIGVMKVKVTGLKPDTDYFLQTETTVKDPGDTTVFPHPVDPPFLRVRTEKASVPVRNDVMAMRVTLGESKTAPGMLVVASIVDEASYPVSGWVGHGVADGWVLIDSNNFYDKNTSENLELIGGENIKLMLVGGTKGSVETQDNVPDPGATGGIQALAAVANLPDTGLEPGVPGAGPTDGIPNSQVSSGN